MVRTVLQGQAQNIIPMDGISVIISYHNESATLEKTLNLLVDQTFPPKEVLLINSSSTDDSFMVIQKWVDRNQSKHKIKVLNIDEGTNVPGSSMNVGIRRASGNILAFMDCGLLFEEDWLQSQTEFMEIHGSEIVSGFCYFKGKTLFDKSAVAQTYGYQQVRPTVPSSLVKKTVFQKTGLFLENRRSGHDVDWMNKLARKKIRRDINRDVRIRYDGFNYAKSIKDIFLKTIKYSENNVGLYHYYNHHIYGLFLFFMGLLYVIKIRFFRPWLYNEYIPLAHIDKLWLYININTAMLLLVFYIVFRGYMIPFFRSRNLCLIYDHPLSMVTLPVVGLIIDFGKIIGYIKGISKHQIRAIINIFSHQKRHEER